MSAGMINSPSTASSTTKTTRFLFINGNESEARRHAMREHWRKRKERDSAAERHYKSLRILRPAPEKEHMVCIMEAQSHSDDPIPSHDHSYSHGRTSISTREYTSNMQLNPDEDTIKAAVVQSQAEYRKSPAPGTCSP